MEGRLANKIVLIPGGGSGMGRAGAEACAAAGATVVVADINPTSAEQVAQQIRARGGQASAAVVDVAQSTQVQTLVTDTVARWGGLMCSIIARRMSILSTTVTVA